MAERSETALSSPCLFIVFQAKDSRKTTGRALQQERGGWGWFSDYRLLLPAHASAASLVLGITCLAQAHFVRIGPSLFPWFEISTTGSVNHCPTRTRPARTDTGCFRIEYHCLEGARFAADCATSMTPVSKKDACRLCVYVYICIYTYIYMSRVFSLRAHRSYTWFVHK